MSRDGARAKTRRLMMFSGLKSGQADIRWTVQDSCHAPAGLRHCARRPRKPPKQVLGQNPHRNGFTLGLAIDVSCGARVTRAEEKWRRSPPCERGEARRLQSLLVCAPYKPGSPALAWVAQRSRGGERRRCAVRWGAATGHGTPMRRTVSIGIVLAEVGGESLARRALSPPSVARMGA